MPMRSNGGAAFAGLLQSYQPCMHHAASCSLGLPPAGAQRTGSAAAAAVRPWTAQALTCACAPPASLHELAALPGLHALAPTRVYG